MAKEDEEKTAFLTPAMRSLLLCVHVLRPKECWSSFHRLMHVALGPQMRLNTEAYVDDIVIKTREANSLLADLEETFANLRRVNLKLNPSKCVFVVPSGNCWAS